MYKKIFTIFALAASLLACNKVENEVVAPETGAKTLAITASIGEPATRLAYSEAADGSYKARFDNNDVIWAYFAKADNTVTGDAVKLTIDQKSISFDGKSACFRQPAVTVPSDAAKIIAYLSSTANTTNFDGGDEIVADISSQANITAALNNQVVFGSVNLSDLKSTDPDVLAASIPFSYKTSLVKFSLALPEGTEVDPATAVSVALTAGKIHNKLHISGGVLGAKSEEGDIALGATLANGVVSASAAVWAEDDLTSKINVTVGEDTYYVDFKPSAAIAAGKVYTVERTLTVSPKPVTMWANDDAASADFKYSGGEDVANDWLSCKDGKVSWTANTTGAPRTAKLSFKNGASFELTQLAAADFKGSWSFTTKVFAGAGSYVSAADPYTFETVTFGEPRNTDALVDADGKTYTNNIGIKGLFFDTTLDACVDIDYDAQTVRVGLFLDTRDGVGQEVDGKYATYFPGLATKTATAWGKPWIYTETELGDPDYAWMWFEVSEDYKTITYLNRTTNDVELQTLTQYTNATMNQICGFGVVLSGTNAFNHSTVTAYSGFYQCNPKNQKGEFFTRK